MLTHPFTVVGGPGQLLVARAVRRNQVGNVGALSSPLFQTDEDEDCNSQCCASGSVTWHHRHRCALTAHDHIHALCLEHT